MYAPNKDIAVLIYFNGNGFLEPSMYPNFCRLKGFFLCVMDCGWNLQRKSHRKRMLKKACQLLLPITQTKFLGSSKTLNQPITFASTFWFGPLC